MLFEIKIAAKPNAHPVTMGHPQALLVIRKGNYDSLTQNCGKTRSQVVGFAYELKSADSLEHSTRTVRAESTCIFWRRVGAKS